MKILLLFAFLFFEIIAYAQTSNCYCAENKFMNGATVSCDTIFLSNGSKTYWQFNCKRIWLTLENRKGEKFTIDEVPVDFYGYTYRLGYHLIKEYCESLLFRSGCPANGPCIYTLINKNTGNKLKEFPQLICIDTDIAVNSHPYPYDFVIYLENEKLIVYYVNNGKTLSIPFREELDNLIPEHSFKSMKVKDNFVQLKYMSNQKKKAITINLN